MSTTNSCHVNYGSYLVIKVMSTTVHNMSTTHRGHVNNTYKLCQLHVEAISIIIITHINYTIKSCQQHFTHFIKIIYCLILVLVTSTILSSLSSGFSLSGSTCVSSWFSLSSCYFNWNTLCYVNYIFFYNMQNIFIV